MAGGLIVAKCGGTSVASAEQLRKVAAIVAANPARQVVVPSAPGKLGPGDAKITDLLYLAHRVVAEGRALKGAGGGKQAAALLDPIWETIAGRYLDIVRDLDLALDLAPALAEVRARIEAGASADYAASRGEALHGRVVAALLGAEYIDAAEVVRFDKSGRLDPGTYELIATRCQGGGRRVIPGFYGSTPSGEIRTLSRGGSDVTGAIVARALKAALYENWTDVSGVLMTDPRVVPEARPISEITYRELRELSYMGASVLHEEAVFPVRDPGIPINIRNTNRPEDPGTMIVAERDPGTQVVVGIAGTKGFTAFNVEKALMNSEVGFGRRLLDVFERLAIPYEHTPTGIDTMSVVVSDRHLSAADGTSRTEQLLEDIQAAVRPDVVKMVSGLALVATVGQGMNHAIGTAARLFTALSKARVNVKMIDQGSSEQNIIVGVEDDDLATAIRAIYNEFA
jgi:aspartate kinase